jgi:hypothetical protein
MFVWSGCWTQKPDETFDQVLILELIRSPIMWRVNELLKLLRQCRMDFLHVFPFLTRSESWDNQQPNLRFHKLLPLAFHVSEAISIICCCWIRLAGAVFPTLHNIPSFPGWFRQCQNLPGNSRTIGQLEAKSAQCCDVTFTDSHPRYFHEYRYSLPGAVP